MDDESFEELETLLGENGWGDIFSALYDLAKDYGEDKGDYSLADDIKRLIIKHNY